VLCDDDDDERVFAIVLMHYDYLEFMSFFMTLSIYTDFTHCFSN